MIGVLALLVTMLLIVLLLIRELVSGIDGPRFKQLRQTLNLVIGPLSVVFFIAVVARLTTLQATPLSAETRPPVLTAIAEAPTPPPTASPSVATAVPTARAAIAEAPTTPPTARPPVATAQPEQTDAPLSVTVTPQQLAGSTFVSDTFSVASGGWVIRKAKTWSAAYADGCYQLVLDGQNSIGISTRLPADNYRLSLDVAIQRGGAGLVFLAHDPAIFYQLLLSADGAYAIQMVDQAAGTTTNLVDWTESAALARVAGATNHLRLERRGDVVAFFANNQPLTTFQVPAGQFHNQYGFALASKQGQAEASFDNLFGERLLPA